MPLCYNQITVRTENSVHTSGECCKGVPHQPQTRRMHACLGDVGCSDRGRASINILRTCNIPTLLLYRYQNNKSKKAVLRGKGEKLERPFLISIDKAMSLKGFIRLDPSADHNTMLKCQIGFCVFRIL